MALSSAISSSSGRLLSENIRARLKRPEDRGWLRRTAVGKFIIAP